METYKNTETDTYTYTYMCEYVWVPTNKKIIWMHFGFLVTQYVRLMTFIKSFEVRQSARAEEIDSLFNAKAEFVYIYCEHVLLHCVWGWVVGICNHWHIMLLAMCLKRLTYEVI